MVRVLNANSAALQMVKSGPDSCFQDTRHLNESSLCPRSCKCQPTVQYVATHDNAADALAKGLGCHIT
eukprot:5575263-Prorocentrum_lima.AAC.1